MQDESDSTAGHSRQKPYKRPRLFWFVAAIAMLAALWSGAWHLGARELDARFAAFSGELARRGGAVSCQNREVKGYPFRIGLFCDRFAYADPRGSSIDAGSLRTAAQLYAPGRIVGELDGPAEITTAARRRFGLTYESAQVSGRIGFGGPQAASLVLGRPVLLDGGIEGAVAGNAEEAQLHLRRNPEDAADLDLALSGGAVDLSGIDLPTFSIAGDFLLIGLANAIGPGFSLNDHLRQNGLGGEIRQLAVTPQAGGRIALSGPFQVNQNGVVDGDFTLSAEQFASLAGFLSGLFPENADEIRVAAGIFAGLAKPANGETAKASELRVTVRQGRIQLGFLKLGEIAPLW